MSQFKSFIPLLQEHTLIGLNKLELRAFSATSRIIYWKSIPQLLVPLLQWCVTLLLLFKWTRVYFQEQKHAFCCRQCKPVAFGDGPFFSQERRGVSWLHAKEIDWGISKSSDNSSGPELPPNPPWSSHTVLQRCSESLCAVAIVWTSQELCMTLSSCFHYGLWHWERIVWALWKEKVGCVLQ